MFFNGKLLLFRQREQESSSIFNVISGYIFRQLNSDVTPNELCILGLDQEKQFVSASNIDVFSKAWMLSGSSVNWGQLFLVPPCFCNEISKNRKVFFWCSERFLHKSESRSVHFLEVIIVELFLFFRWGLWWRFAHDLNRRWRLFLKLSNWF